MTNIDKLKTLLMDVFVLSEEEFHFDLTQRDIEAWDSLGVVSVAVGIEETFGYHFKPEEAMAISSVKEIMRILQQNGISFED